MAYKCSFLDSETYSAQDVNDIFARITSGGVIFNDTGYTIGDLNYTQSNVVTGGITRDTNSCKVVKNGTTYKISKGVCFMNDGTMINFDEDGYEIEITPKIKNYVYLRRNVVANTIDIIVSETQGDADSIPLAEIDEKGNVYDRRKYAMAKVDLATSQKFKNFTVNIPKSSNPTTGTVTADLGEGAFSYITVWSGTRTYNDEIHARVPNGKNLVELIDDVDVRISIGDNLGQKTEEVYFKKDGQKVHVHLKSATTGAEYVLNMGVV